MDGIMSISIILLDQTSNANDVDIMVFGPSVLFPPLPARVWGEYSAAQKYWNATNCFGELVIF